MKNSVRYIAILSFFYACTIQSAELKHSDVARCFFVYAPIFETGREVQNNALFVYAQKRIAWATGYLQAYKNNPEFEAIFDRDLKKNKEAGIELESRLLGAILSNDAYEYSSVMDVARECDALLGLPSKDIPPL